MKIKMMMDVQDSAVEKINKRGALILVFILSIVVFSGRRMDQIIFPEVWNEDGLEIIPAFLDEGFRAIFLPTNGYVILPSRIITYISLKISFLHYPVVSTYMGIFIQSLCVTIVAAAPTALPFKFWAALLLLILPTDPEVYALPQYTFWWTTLLLFLSLLWLPGRKPVTRNAFAVIGGFSSPIGIALLPIFFIRTVLTRQKEDVVLTSVLACVAAVQTYFVMHGDPTQRNVPSIHDVVPAIDRFFGHPTLAVYFGYSFSFGLAMAAFLFAGFFIIRAESRSYYFFVALVLGAAMVSAMLRVPISIASPIGDGPRYFFYPLVCTSWMLLWIIRDSHALWKVVAYTFVASMLPVSVAYFYRGQEHLEPWAAEVSKCLTADKTLLPIHHDGKAKSRKQMYYTQEQCRAGVDGSLF